MSKVLKTTGVASRIVSNFLSISIGFLIIAAGIMIIIFSKELQKEAELQVAAELEKIPEELRNSVPDPIITTHGKEELTKLWIVGGITVVCSLFSLGLSKLFCCLKIPVNFLFVGALAGGYTALAIWIQTKTGGFISFTGKFNVGYTIDFMGESVTKNIVDIREYAEQYINWIKLGAWILSGSLIIATIITLVQVIVVLWKCIRKDDERDGDDKKAGKNKKGKKKNVDLSTDDDHEQSDDGDFDAELGNNAFNNGGRPRRNDSNRGGGGDNDRIIVINNHLPRNTSTGSYAGSQRSNRSNRSQRVSFKEEPPQYAPVPAPNRRSNDFLPERSGRLRNEPSNHTTDTRLTAGFIPRTQSNIGPGDGQPDILDDSDEFFEDSDGNEYDFRDPPRAGEA